MRRLSARSAQRCEDSESKRCRCRCQGAAHGVGRDVSKLKRDDPHYVERPPKQLALALGDRSP